MGKYTNYIIRALQAGEKITLNAGAVGLIEGVVEWGDKVVLVPFCSAVKVGDLVYCDVDRWTRLRTLVNIHKGKFKVRTFPSDKAKEVKFEDIYGQVYEIKKRPKSTFQYEFDEYD